MLVCPRIVAAPSLPCLVVPPASAELDEGVSDGEGVSVGEGLGEAEGSVDGEGLTLGLELGSVWAKAVTAPANIKAQDVASAKAAFLNIMQYLDYLKTG